MGTSLNPDLLAVLVCCLLLWPVSRRLGLPRAAAGLAVALGALLAGPVAASGGADPGGPAVLWLAVAATLAGPGAARGVSAAVAALACAFIAPVAAVGLLVLAAHLIATSAVGTTWSAARRRWAAVLTLAAAATVAVLATGDRPLALAADPAFGGAAVEIGLAAVTAYLLVVTGLTWAGLRWLRPVAGAAVVLLGCAYVPGTDVAAVLLLVAPVLAVVTAAVVAEARVAVRVRRFTTGLAVVALVAATAPLTVPGLTASGGVLSTPAGNSAGPEGVPGVRPSWISIPVLGVTSRLEDLTVDHTAELLAPEKPGVAGWFAAGPVPGDVGPAVIGGHVDSDQGPGAFLHLRRLVPGDVVLVGRSDGPTTRFQVSSVRHYPKERFPTRRVYGPTPAPVLRLVTCGGAFDRVESSYRDNVVVEAVLV